MNISFENVSKMLYVMRTMAKSGQTILTEDATITSEYVADLLNKIEGENK